MEFKTLANGTEIPVLGLGTWSIGGERTRDDNHDDEGISAIKNAIKLGYRHIDTAEMYGAGHSEELVGEAIKNFDRKDLFITTKVAPENLRYDDVISSAKKSMKRLGTEYIDMYLIHAPNPNIPIQETMKAFDFLVEKKMIRFIGVSNFSSKQLEEAQSHTENKIAANQIEYNLFVRNNGLFTNGMESNIIPYCQKNDIIVIAWRPLRPLIRNDMTKPGFKLLDSLAKKYDKTKTQIALNWLISKDNIITIPKTTQINHLKDNLGAVGWSMDKEDIKKLDNFNL